MGASIVSWDAVGCATIVKAINVNSANTPPLGEVGRGLLLFMM
jgi:hypothetical protein